MNATKFIFAAEEKRETNNQRPTAGGGQDLASLVLTTSNFKYCFLDKHITSRWIWHGEMLCFSAFHCNHEIHFLISISGAATMWRAGQNDVRSWIHEQSCGKMGLASWHTLSTPYYIYWCSAQQPNLHQVKFMGRYLTCLCHSAGQKE